ncbi:MAG: small multi-drug export protein [Methanophagales archaeon]|nr:small multi-drug export protein [Methanophagales archaeon]
MIVEVEKEVRRSVIELMQMKKIALAKLFIPLGIAAAAILFFAFFVDPKMKGKFLTVLLAYMTPLGGPLIAAPLGIALLTPVVYIAFIVFTDALFALFLVWNFDYTKKLPVIGKFVERLGEKGEETLEKHKWTKRLGFIGVVFLIMYPIAAGAGIGSVVGRLIGLSPLLTWIAVVLGTFLQATILVYSGLLIAFLIQLLY